MRIVFIALILGASASISFGQLTAFGSPATGIGFPQILETSVNWNTGADVFVSPNAPVVAGKDKLQWKVRMVWIDTNNSPPNMSKKSSWVTITEPDSEGNANHAFVITGHPTWFNAGDFVRVDWRLKTSDYYTGPAGPAGKAQWRVRSNSASTANFPFGSTSSIPVFQTSGNPYFHQLIAY